MPKKIRFPEMDENKKQNGCLFGFIILLFVMTGVLYYCDGSKGTSAPPPTQTEKVQTTK